MRRMRASLLVPAILGSLLTSETARGQARPQLPEAPARETTKRVCGACHPAEVVLGRGMTREQWGNMVSNMISRGAKGSDEEFAQIVDYLAKNLPPGKTGTDTAIQAAANAPNAGPTAPVSPARKRGPSLIDQAGAADKHIVDEEAAKRGRTVYIAQCITCHGPKGRGTDSGPDMVRSLVILKDRYGSQIAPFLQKGHPMQSGASSSSLSKEQVEDLSHFLHEKVGDTLRTGPYNSVLNVLTGDPKAGKAYFNGAGQCATCHSPTGDLAGIGSRYEPPVLQLKTVFPQTVAFGKRQSASTRKPVTVTVTTPSGESVHGVLLQMDDFDVSLRDDAGQFHAFSRTPDLKVEKQNPYAAHESLLDQYTDTNIHDLVAYLETLK